MKAVSSSRFIGLGGFENVRDGADLQLEGGLCLSALLTAPSAPSARLRDLIATEELLLLGDGPPLFLDTCPQRTFAGPQAPSRRRLLRRSAKGIQMQKAALGCQASCKNRRASDIVITLGFGIVLELLLQGLVLVSHSRALGNRRDAVCAAWAPPP